MVLKKKSFPFHNDVKEVIEFALHIFFFQRVKFIVKANGVAYTMCTVATRPLILFLLVAENLKLLNTII